MSEAEARLLSNVATKQADAAAALRRRMPPASAFLVVTIVVGEFVGVGIVASHADEATRFLVGGIAGAALGLAAIAYGEIRKLRQRVEALIVLEARSS